MDSGSQYVLLIVCILLSAFFSGSETALTSVSKIRLRAMVDENRKNAKLLQKVLDQSNKLISAILIGNNIVNIGASSLATIIAMEYGGNAVGYAAGLLTLVILVFGEITPKTFARENCESISLLVVKPIYLCMVILTPIIFLLNVITSIIFKFIGNKTDNSPTVTETELLTMVDVSHEEGVLEIEEREMITNVVDFRNSNAVEVMVPRTDMVAIPITSTYEEVVAVFKTERFTRLPVYNETNDHIVGILSFKDVMLLDNSKDFKVSDYMKEPYFTYESKPCSSLFATMKHNSVSMAIVLDEYGGTAGIVTLQDLIQEIVGDILDEIRDEEEEIIAVNDKEYIVEGSAKLDDVNDVLNTNFTNDDVESIGGYVIALIDRFPENGEVIESNDAYFEVMDIDKNRIVQIKITVKPKNDNEEKES